MLIRIIKKEVKELFKKSTLISMIIIAFMFGYLGKIMSSMGDTIKEKPQLQLIVKDKGIFTDIMRAQIEQYADISEQTGVNTVIIEKGFTDSILKGKQGSICIQYFMKGAGVMNSIESGGFEHIINMSGNVISDSLIRGAYDFAPDMMRNPIAIKKTTFIKGRKFDNADPGAIMAVLSTQVSTLPILIMMLIIMSGSTVISSMAFEKENKTLETLLTMPVKRSNIIAGKIIGSAIVGLVFAGIYILGFRYYMNSLSMGSTMTSLNMQLNTQQMILLLLSFLTSLLAGLAACMLLGAFTKDSKTSQTMIFPISVSAMFSMFLTMFIDYATMAPVLKVIYFIIPFSHPMMAFRELLFGNYVIVVWGILYCFAFFIVMIGITTYIFNSDILLIGSLSKLKKENSK